MGVGPRFLVLILGGITDCDTLLLRSGFSKEGPDSIFNIQYLQHNIYVAFQHYAISPTLGSVVLHPGV